MALKEKVNGKMVKGCIGLMNKIQNKTEILFYDIQYSKLSVNAL